MSSADAIRICRGTSTQRATATAITPPAGVPGFESNTGLLFVADGAKTWAAMGSADTIAAHPARLYTPSGMSTLTGITVANDDVVLIWDTSASAWKAITKSDLVGGGGGGSGGILSEAYPDTTRTNSTTDVDLVSYTIPGGTLTADGQTVTSVSEGLVLNNTGANKYLFASVDLAGTVSMQDGTTAFATSSSWRAFKVTSRAIRVSATSGITACELFLSTPGGSATLSGGDFGGNATFNLFAWGVLVDTGLAWASDVAFGVRLRTTDASANLTINHKLTRIYR